MAKARAHAPNQPALDLERILEMAKRTPYYEECLEAIDLLTNPARWSQAETMTSESIPPSRVRKDFVDDMVKSDIITEFDGMEWEGISYTNRNILIMEVTECNDVLLKCLSK